MRPRPSALVTLAVGLPACLVACHPAAGPAPAPAIPATAGRHHDEVEAQVRPMLDAELISGIVVGLYDAGRVEVYGFGAGPGHAPPDGNTLFELGPVSSTYTSILLADAVQRREVLLDTPVAELLPPGVTMPVRDKQVIVLKDLALHTGGLPRLPPRIAMRPGAPDPFAGYGEEALYHDLIATELIAAPGTEMSYSLYSTGLLGFVLGRKLPGGFAKALEARVLRPLELTDTFLAVPPARAAQRAAGTTDDLAPTPAWTFDAMAGAAGLVSSARDQLRLIGQELDAADGATRGLGRALKLTQEPQLERAGANVGLGWMIDPIGRYWHNGSTGGFHSFVGFDPKTRRGVVVLTATSTVLVDRLPDALYKILEGSAPPPPTYLAAAGLAPLAGTYDLSGTKLKVIVEGKRLYLEGPGEPRHRLAQASEREFWIQALESRAAFDSEGSKVVRLRFTVGERLLIAPRVD
mgnify:CR=1 FL=1